EDIDLIRKMADRYEDGEIARVLNKMNRRTGKGLPWSQSRVADVRRKHGIAGGRPGHEGGMKNLRLAHAEKPWRVREHQMRRLVAVKRTLVRLEMLLASNEHCRKDSIDSPTEPDLARGDCEEASPTCCLKPNHGTVAAMDRAGSRDGACELFRRDATM